MLSRMDDYLVHQTREPLASIASDHPDWQEAVFFNAHDEAGEFCSVMGFEVLPNGGHARGFFFTLHRGEHYASISATPLESWRDEMRVGTLEFSVVDPLRSWHIEAADEAHGIRASLDFEARCPAYLFEPIRCSIDGKSGIDQSYFNQAGTYSGTFRVGGGESTRLQGLRARRWGPLNITGLPFYQWISVQLAGRVITCWQFESAAGQVLYCDGALISESGEVDKIVRLAHDWTFEPGMRHPRQAQLALSLASGAELDLECREIGSIFMGAGPQRFSHSDAEALRTAEAQAFSIETYCEFRLGDERGLGMLDSVCLPGYQRYGIAPLAV